MSGPDEPIWAEGRSLNEIAEEIRRQSRRAKSSEEVEALAWRCYLQGLAVAERLLATQIAAVSTGLTNLREHERAARGQRR